MSEWPDRIGAYPIEREIGRGGMGIVYLARDEELDRAVAIKVLPDSVSDDPVRLARFDREARMLGALNHPNIAAIYGLEQAEGKRFLVLELVEGETLEQRIGKGALPVDDALAICRQIADGLEAGADDFLTKAVSGDELRARIAAGEPRALQADAIGWYAPEAMPGSAPRSSSMSSTSIPRPIPETTRLSTVTSLKRNGAIPSP